MKDRNEFDLLKELQKRRVVENPYQRFSLTGNPFPKSAIADFTSESFFSRCRRDALEKIKDFVVYASASKRWGGLVLRGEYGSGKSHLLFYVTNEVNRQLGTLDKDRVLAIYIETPSYSINDLYKDFMEKLGRENFESKVAIVIENMAKEAFEGLPHQAVITEDREIAQDPLSRLRRIGKALLKRRQNEAYDKLSKKLMSIGFIEQRDFARCLGILICGDDQETRNAAWKFCIGNAVSSSEAKKLGLVSKRLSEDEITRFVFPSVIQILHKNSVAMVILFIDEIEKIATKPSSFRFEFLENLRSLIDNNLDHFSMIWACVTEAWEILSSTSPGLSERIGEIVDLDPLDDSEAMLLIKDYLNEGRIESYEGSELSPFEEGAVEKINRFSKGSIRYILQNSHTILEHAVSTEEIEDKITPEFVNKILRD